MAAAFRSNAREAADEWCSFMHIQRLKLGEVGSKELANLLDFPGRDETWISPEGIDLTELCGRSSTGGFSSNQWTLQGWILDDSSMAVLRREFPS